MAKTSQGTVLTELAEAAEVFVGDDAETVFATVAVREHLETWPILSRGFQRWLTARYLERVSEVPGEPGMKAALLTIEARAHAQAVQHSVYVRVAPGVDGSIVIDLANADWTTVVISPDGWTVAPSPVRFRRMRGQGALPTPTRSGTLAALRPFVNLQDDDDWLLLQAWLLSAVRPQGPFPVLALNGEQGSAKSTTARVLRQLLDPNWAPLRCEPSDRRDLAIAAQNSWVIALDNLSHLRPWLSDALCRLSTGGGFSTRQLYRDDEEKLFTAMRPVILNGIEEVATRPDLIDRAVTLSLPAITDRARRTEREFWASFTVAQSQLLGALFDAVVASLEGLPGVTLTGSPRMADFVAWTLAAESALGWTAGAFMRVYGQNRGEANTIAIDASPVGALLVALTAEVAMTEAGEWVGTAGELLKELAKRAGDDLTRQPDWPRTPRALSGELRRLGPALRSQGVDVIVPDSKHREPNRGRRRLYRLRPAQPSTPSEPSTPHSTPGAEVKDPEDFGPEGTVDGRVDDVDGLNEAGVTPSTRNPAKTQHMDDVDDVDGHAGRKEDDLWR